MGPLIVLALLEPASSELAFAQARYEDAIVAANTEIRAGHLSREALCARERVLGWSYVATGQREAALHSFGLAMTLDPAIDLPPEAPPKVLEAFVSARRLHGGVGLRLRVDPVGGAGARSVVLRVAVVGDPLGLVARIRARSREPGGAWREVSSAASAAGTEVDLGHGARRGAVEYVVEALDAHDNVAAALGEDLRPLVALLAPAFADRPAAQASWSQRRWFWPVVVAGSLAALAGGTVWALRGGGTEDRVPLQWLPSTVR